MDNRSAGSGPITLGPRRRGGGGFKNTSMDKGSNDNSASSSGRNTPITAPRNPFDILDSDAENPEKLELLNLLYSLILTFKASSTWRQAVIT